MKTSTLITGFLAVALVAGVTGYTMVRSGESSATKEPLSGQGTQAASMAQASSATAEDQSPGAWRERVEQLAARLQEDYGDTISEPSTQAYLFIERENLADAHPRDGRALFDAAVAKAFPQLATAILELMAGMDTYHQWLADNELTLREMEPMQRRAAIWKTREEIFGALASAIWGEEETLVSKHSDAMSEALARLDQAHELTPEEVAHQITTTVEDLYGLEAAGQLVTPHVLGQTLFSLDSVQADLEGLSPEARQKRIDALRRQLGYTEDQVRTLKQKDQQRNQRWQEGEAYMAQRQQLSQRYQGDQLEQALEDLREEHFGNASKTIAREEQDGFFRFQRPRRYGVN